MNLSATRRLRFSRSAFGLGLAAVVALISTSEPASAQRRATAGDVWQATSRSAQEHVSTSVSFGPRDPSARSSFAQRRRDHRNPRGFRGGRYETRYEKVWVPGRSRRVWVPPVYEWRCGPFGTQIRVCVRAGFHRTVCEPGRYETRALRVWVPARRAVGHLDRVTHVGRRYRR